MPTYAQNKQFIYNWRALNPDKLRAINRKSKAKTDCWLKAKRIYLAILREE